MPTNAQHTHGATLDTAGGHWDANRIRTAVATELEIRGGIRMRQLGDMVTPVPYTRAAKTKHLHVGSMEMDEVTDEWGAIEQGRPDIGAVYTVTKEYAKEVPISGKEMRTAEAGFIPQLANRLSEAMDHTFDRGVIEAALGDMLVGDECRPQALPQKFRIEHNGQGITPEKLTKAIRILGEYNSGQNVSVMIDPRTAEQLTGFEVFTNNDFLIDGMPSAYTATLLRAQSRWFGATFRHVSDRRRDRTTLHPTSECGLMPTIPVSRYAADPTKVVRHIPVFVKSAVYWQPGYAPEVNMTEGYWKQHSKPRGNEMLRIDGEFGFGRNDNCGVVVIEVLQDAEDLILTS